VDKTGEKKFQQRLVEQLRANGWLEGKSAGYNRRLALYGEDLLGFVKETQDAEWQRFQALYPEDPEGAFLERVASQLEKVDLAASDKTQRRFGTLGVLRNGVEDRGIRFRLCQFTPEHSLNPQVTARHEQNRLRVVQELVYSPWATGQQRALTGKQAKFWRLDLVLFLNGLPVVTMELKSEVNQSLQEAIKQYQTTRLPIDPKTKKPQPLLTFKRGALVHFAVSQYKVAMTTRLAGEQTRFLPFNKGRADGSAGNDTPEDKTQHATGYLWNEVLLPDNLLAILARFMHLEIKEKDDGEGGKQKQETLIFPRYHQWDVVNKLVDTIREEGPGQKYLIQHSAGSGKSNSIAWAAHQLSTLHSDLGDKFFDSVIVVTDRTVLDDQLQETIAQFSATDGVVEHISHERGGSKSQKLGAALEGAKAIIIVTIQTFPYVLNAIESSAILKTRNFAIIADEAHSSQTGTSANQLRQLLAMEEDDTDEWVTGSDILDAAIVARRNSTNITYLAFTATPKSKTLELFGRVPRPGEPPSKLNLPQAFHVYTMRQAIEENYILDVLKNYTNYRDTYRLAMKINGIDQEVESKKAKVKLRQWVRLNETTIKQKIEIIVEHFKNNVADKLNGQAKAMIVTASRKEAVRFKLAFDKYIAKNASILNYRRIKSMVAFSGEVQFTELDPDSAGLLDESFTESSMNTGLNRRKMREAFDSDDFQIMIVANKFQTGFDQPKLCAMYVDKKLSGVECVQTLSRLNRIYPNKTETAIVDFVNEPDEILASFQPYYQTAELTNVTDPDQVSDLFAKLYGAAILVESEVVLYYQAFINVEQSKEALDTLCKPAVDRWTRLYRKALDKLEKELGDLAEARESGRARLIGSAETRVKECKQEKDGLEIFKKDLASFSRLYEFMSQIVDYKNPKMAQLSPFARVLARSLKLDSNKGDLIDLDSVEIDRYRLSLIRQLDLELAENSPDYKLEPGDSVGSGVAKDGKREFLSRIIEQLNDTFPGDDDSNDPFNAIVDHVSKNPVVMDQMRNNPPEQVLLGELNDAMDSAVMDNLERYPNLMNQLLSEPDKKDQVSRLVIKVCQQRLQEGGSSVG